MSEELGPLSHGGEDSPPAAVTHELIFFLVLLFNVVTVGLGGLYVTTRSIAVVSVAAGLVALLGGLCLMVRTRNGS